MFALSATGGLPTIVRNSPVPIMMNTPAAKRYVGVAKASPASLSPRRLMAASTATNMSAITTRCGPRPGTAEMMLSTPEDTDTATVIT